MQMTKCAKNASEFCSKVKYLNNKINFIYRFGEETELMNRIINFLHKSLYFLLYINELYRDFLTAQFLFFK